MVGRMVKLPVVLALLLSTLLMQAGCDFRAEYSTLRVGMSAPSLRTKTLADVGGDFSRITTYRQPDARMYQLSLDQALLLKIPLVVEFATPGHCTVCDKQLQMLKAIMNKYEPDVAFLHMDQYQNVGAFKAYMVQGDPWTFIIDSKGVVRFKRPGRMLYGELDRALAKIISADS